MKRLVGWVSLAGLLGSASALAQPPREIYVSTGEHGETSFSDVARPGAERIEVAPVEPPEGAQEDLERRIEQTLRVANALEESRLAREKARAAARTRADALQRAAAQAEPTPQGIYQDRYVGSPYLWHSPYGHRFPPHSPFRGHDRFDMWSHGKEQWRDREPREREMSRKFPYDAD